MSKNTNTNTHQIPTVGTIQRLELSQFDHDDESTVCTQASSVVSGDDNDTAAAAAAAAATAVTTTGSAVHSRGTIPVPPPPALAAQQVQSPSPPPPSPPAEEVRSAEAVVSAAITSSSSIISCSTSKLNSDMFSGVIQELDKPPVMNQLIDYLELLTEESGSKSHKDGVWSLGKIINVIHQGDRYFVDIHFPGWKDDENVYNIPWKSNRIKKPLQHTLKCKGLLNLNFEPSKLTSSPNKYAPWIWPVKIYLRSPVDPQSTFIRKFFRDEPKVFMVPYLKNRIPKNFKKLFRIDGGHWFKASALMNMSVIEHAQNGRSDAFASAMDKFSSDNSNFLAAGNFQEGTSALKFLFGSELLLSYQPDGLISQDEDSSDERYDMSPAFIQTGQTEKSTNKSSNRQGAKQSRKTVFSTSKCFTVAVEYCPTRPVKRRSLKNLPKVGMEVDVSNTSNTNIWDIARVTKIHKLKVGGVDILSVDVHFIGWKKSYDVTSLPWDTGMVAPLLTHCKCFKGLLDTRDYLKGQDVTSKKVWPVHVFIRGFEDTDSILKAVVEREPRVYVQPYVNKNNQDFLPDDLRRLFTMDRGNWFNTDFLCTESALDDGTNSELPGFQEALKLFKEDDLDFVSCENFHEGTCVLKRSVIESKFGAHSRQLDKEDCPDGESRQEYKRSSSDISGLIVKCVTKRKWPGSGFESAMIKTKSKENVDRTDNNLKVSCFISGGLNAWAMDAFIKGSTYIPRNFGKMAFSNAEPLPSTGSEIDAMDSGSIWNLSRVTAVKVSLKHEVLIDCHPIGWGAEHDQKNILWKSKKIAEKNSHTRIFKGILDINYDDRNDPSEENAEFSAVKIWPVRVFTRAPYDPDTDNQHIPFAGERRLFMAPYELQKMPLDYQVLFSTDEGWWFSADSLVALTKVDSQTEDSLENLEMALQEFHSDKRYKFIDASGFNLDSGKLKHTFKNEPTAKPKRERKSESLESARKEKGQIEIANDKETYDSEGSKEEVPVKSRKRHKYDYDDDSTVTDAVEASGVESDGSLFTNRPYPRMEVDFLEVMDNSEIRENGIWNPGKITKVEKFSPGIYTVTVHYVGWGSEHDVKIKWDSDRIAPAFSTVRLFKGILDINHDYREKKKIRMEKRTKLKKHPLSPKLWPVKVYVRVPYNIESKLSEKELDAVSKVFVVPFSAKELPKNYRRVFKLDDGAWVTTASLVDSSQAELHTNSRLCLKSFPSVISKFYDEDLEFIDSEYFFPETSRLKLLYPNQNNESSEEAKNNDHDSSTDSDDRSNLSQIIPGSFKNNRSTTVWSGDVLSQNNSDADLSDNDSIPQRVRWKVDGRNSSSEDEQVDVSCQKLAGVMDDSDNMADDSRQKDQDQVKFVDEQDQPWFKDALSPATTHEPPRCWEDEDASPDAPPS